MKDNELIKLLRERAEQRLIDRDSWNITDEWIREEMIIMLRKYNYGEEIVEKKIVNNKHEKSNPKLYGENWPYSQKPFKD